MNLKCLTILYVILLQSSVSTFETNMGPGEGPTEYAAASNTLQLRELPSGASRTVRTVRVSHEQRLPYDDTRYRTTQAGHIRVLVSSHITGRMIGPVRGLSSKEYSSDKFHDVNVEIRMGRDIEYLQYRGEGTCFVRLQGNVIEADPCPIYSKSKFKLEIEPKTELWIHTSVGDSVGWLLVNDATAKIVPQ